MQKKDTRTVNRLTRQLKVDALLRPEEPILDERIDLQRASEDPEMNEYAIGSNVIRNQSEKSTDDLFETLAQEGWSAPERKQALSVLIAGEGDIEETTTEARTQHTTAKYVQASGSNSRIGCISISSDSDWQDDGSADDRLMDEPISRTYELPTLTSEEYHQWARETWSVITSEWKQQFNQSIPELQDSRALERFAMANPEVLLELGRWLRIHIYCSIILRKRV